MKHGRATVTSNAPVLLRPVVQDHVHAGQPLLELLHPVREGRERSRYEERSVHVLRSQVRDQGDHLKQSETRVGGNAQRMERAVTQKRDLYTVHAFERRDGTEPGVPGVRRTGWVGVGLWKGGLFRDKLTATEGKSGCLRLFAVPRRPATKQSRAKQGKAQAQAQQNKAGLTRKKQHGERTTHQSAAVFRNYIRAPWYRDLKIYGVPRWLCRGPNVPQPTYLDTAVE